MARNLYRLYLYAVFLAMLIFAAVGLAIFVQPLLALTALRGAYTPPPSSSALVQQGVFFAVSWLIAGVLGGLHYWLIRRDMRNDPDAGDSGIRAFFLNMALLIAAPLGIGFAAGSVIAQLGLNYSGDISGSAAFALATLSLAVVLELERRRSLASSGVALFFQRLSLYGVQFILLLLLIAAWTNAFYVLVNLLAFGGQADPSSVPCVGFVSCDGQNLFSLVAATLWLMTWWLSTRWLARNDAPSLFRRIMHYGSFAIGIGYFLYGVYIGLDLAFRHFSGVEPSSYDTLSSFNFSSYILLGLLITSVYLLWLRASSRHSQDGLVILRLYSVAIVAVLMAGTFYWGIGYLLLNVLELPTKAQDWSSALSLILTGVCYVALDIYLHRGKQTQLAGASDGRRGFVFALLGGGILAVAMGGAVALYALLTSALGSPLDNWPHLAHTGLAAFIAGSIVVAVYFWIARLEKLFSGLRQTGQAGQAAAPAAAFAGAVPPSLPPTAPTIAAQNEPRLSLTIENILDELLAGNVTRDEAAERIRELSRAQ